MPVPIVCMRREFENGRTSRLWLRQLRRSLSTCILADNVGKIGQTFLVGMRFAAFKHTMIKSILALIVFSLLIGSSALAKTLKLPNEEFPIASLSFPDSWEPEEINNGIAGQSPDSAVYLAAVAVGNEKGMEAELEDTFDMLKEHN